MKYLLFILAFFPLFSCSNKTRLSENMAEQHFLYELLPTYEETIYGGFVFEDENNIYIITPVTDTNNDYSNPNGYYKSGIEKNEFIISHYAYKIENTDKAFINIKNVFNDPIPFYTDTSDSFIVENDYIFKNIEVESNSISLFVNNSSSWIGVENTLTITTKSKKQIEKTIYGKIAICRVIGSKLFLGILLIGGSGYSASIEVYDLKNPENHQHWIRHKDGVIRK